MTKKLRFLKGLVVFQAIFLLLAGWIIADNETRVADIDASLDTVFYSEPPEIVRPENMDEMIDAWAVYHPDTPREVLEDIILDMYAGYRYMMVGDGRGFEELPFEWLFSMATVESKGDITARGRAGEISLFQIIPNPARIKNLQMAGLLEDVDDLWNPVTNTICATYTMLHMVDSQGSLEAATVYYNAGRNAKAGSHYLQKVKGVFSGIISLSN